MACKRLVCDCNGTMTVDGATLSRALGEESALKVHSQLCGREAAQFAQAAQQPGELLVACTQEAPAFNELAGARSAPLRFVNIRETAGWSSQGREAMPKMAALLAVASLPEPEPVPSVSYRSEGRLLIAGPAAAALMWAKELSGDLEVSVLVTDPVADAELPAERAFPVFSGRVTAVSGYLGAFAVEWTQSNPIDLDACVRCGACVSACPEAAITAAFQVDPGRCTGHRACVAACGEVNAIDFSRAEPVRRGEFDLILDLGAEPMFAMPQPPQGYFAPGADPMRLARAMRELVSAVGEFDKPRYFRYEASICAHSRSKLKGCNQCIDVCSTGAIRPEGDRIRVEPHLCMGCGGCASVCPSGALSYAFPTVPYQGERLQAALSAYADAGGRDACVLLHDAAGAALIARLARRGKGLPARVIPFEVHHIASAGLDLALASLALGANQFAVLATGEEAGGYRAALAKQFGFGTALLQGLGFGDGQLQLIEAADAAALESALWPLAPARQSPSPATFKLFERKRTTLRFAIEHLAGQAPVPRESVPMPAGAPFGTVEVDRKACTLCMACVGACPESALLDGRDRPQLRFAEVNCVQCGLCEQACPEDAISLVPRVLLTAEAKTERVLNEDQPFHCVRCAKPFGTTRMIENMLGRLAGHSMFASEQALRRVRMCADCRVIDMMEAKSEVSIFDIKR
jgi:ferredoxin